ncbi:MAG: hypothetical protein WCL14_12345 [Bacteroidota bacterium]
MELQFYKTADSTILFTSEMTLIKTALLFADKVNVTSFNFHHFATSLNLDKMPEKDIIKVMHTIQERQGNIKENADLAIFYKNLLMMRNRKNKAKNDLIFLAQLERTYTILVKDVANYFNLFNENNNMACFEGFIADGTLNIIPFNHDKQSETDTIGHRIMDSFLHATSFHLFDESIMRGTVKLTADEAFSDSSHVGASADSDVLSIPNLDSLGYNPLRIIRNELLDGFKLFHKEVEELQREITESLWNFETYDAMQAKFIERLEAITNDYKKTGDENVYFQQIKNSTADKRISTLRIGITSVRSLVYYYWVRNVISIEMRTYIINEIEKHKSADSCSLFFYVESERGNEEFDKLMTPNKEEELLQKP